MSVQDERIQAQRCKACFTGSQNRTVKIDLFTRTEEKFSCKTQPDEIGRASASAEVVTTT
jgi:hypothetical protein